MQTRVDAISEITRVSLFSGLDAGDRVAVAASATLRHAARGNTLFAQGDEPAELLVLVAGWVKLMHVTEAGTQIALGYLHRGDYVGAPSLLRAVSYPAAAVVAADATLLVWKASYIREWMGRSPVVAQNALCIVGTRADEFLSRIQELASDPVETRLARHLCELARGSGQVTERGIDIGFPISRQDLAELCGTTLFTVSRILTRWRDLGLVDPGRQSIVVRDTARLSNIVRESRRSTAR